MKRQREELLHGTGTHQFGKWMLFVDDFEEMWNKVKLLQVFATCPSSSVIFIHSQTSNEEEIIKLGNDIALELEYTSHTGYMCYKASDKLGCSRMSNKENYTYRISVPLSIQTHIPEFDENALQFESGYYYFDIGFQVKEHAKLLGAQYDKDCKKWYAETQEIWEKLAQFWRPIYNSDFSVFSLNIWKSLKDLEERMNFITKEIKSLMPAIVLFQEVTILAFQILDPIMKQLGYDGCYEQSQDFFLVSYYLSKECEFENFEMVRACSNFDEDDESLKQNRCFHILSLSIKQEKVTICNIHLAASESNSDLRLSQFQYLFDKLKHEKFVIAGDTNLSNHDNVELPTDIEDVWKITGSGIGTMGTWNPRENTNLSHISKHVGMCRFDRMYTHEISAQSLQLCLRDKMENLQHVSDHFGLFARFRL
jgi:endonuclease/exonuclease/phosphatase family metal-dependent hydrolase